MEISKLMDRDSFTTARLLSEAMPYIRRYDGATVVIKLGGHAMSSDAAMASFARDVGLMRQCNLRPVIVHGGGPMINAMLERLEIPTTFKGGKRVTSPEVMEVVEMVLSGSVNKRLVAAINAEGAKAVGLSGRDADLIKCDPADPELGLVGAPSKVNPAIIETISKDGFIPVIAPLGFGENGETFNINGDTAAGALAAGLKAERLLLLTDVDGVKDAEGQVLTDLTAGEVADLTAAGVISGGMIPKTETAVEAVKNGVGATVIMNGKTPNACLLELFTTYGAGSLISA